METSDRWDVVVIGAGGAGLSAAIHAAYGGARVIVFESERQIGGSTALSGGVFYAAGTSVQAALGLEDSPERFYQHYMDLNQWSLQPGLIRRYCTESAATFEWLLSLGHEVPPHLSANSHQPGIRRVETESPRRGHIPAGEGYGLAQMLDAERRRMGVEVVLRTRVERILVADGRVTGVVADGIEVTADSVIVASGGMARNPELLERFFPAALRPGDELFIVAADGSRGDHIAFAEQTNSSIVGTGWGVLLIGAYFQQYHHWEAGFPPVARVLVDPNGRRFMDEDAPYTAAWTLFERIGGSAWMIFDEVGRRALKPGYPAWSPDRILAEVEAGRTFAADDLAGLAAQLDLPAQALEATLKRWNDTVPTGTDPDFLRHESLGNHGYGTPDPIVEPPFYAVRTLPNQLVLTHPGIEIDEWARAVDRYGRIIPGLYAAGEAGGGVLGPHYVGATSIGNALTMGRQAGRHAAEVSAAVRT